MKKLGNFFEEINLQKTTQNLNKKMKKIFYPIQNNTNKYIQNNNNNINIKKSKEKS